MQAIVWTQIMDMTSSLLIDLGDLSWNRLTTNQLKMDLKEQVILEYLNLGTSYRALAAKYGIAKSMINRWIMIERGIRNLSPSEEQQKYYSCAMKSKESKNRSLDKGDDQSELQEKIALLEKQLAWEKMRVNALDTMITIAEKQLNISIRKKPGSQQSER